MTARYGTDKSKQEAIRKGINSEGKTPAPSTLRAWASHHTNAFSLFLPPVERRYLEPAIYP